MAYQSVFERYEMKYILTKEKKEAVLKAMQPYMALDQYGRTTIRNLYFDTDNYRLIRRSMEHPVYKEKLRVRSYGVTSSDSAVFVEMKRKCRNVVYKRRVSLPEDDAVHWLSGSSRPGVNTQITQEIDYFLAHYGALHPAVFLCYDREAYYSVDGSDFRVTFDDRILCRQEELSLCTEAYGTSLLSEEMVLMELKCSGGIPLWMVQTLSKEHIYKTSFSKYAAAYQTIIFPKLIQEAALYA